MPKENSARVCGWMHSCMCADMCVSAFLNVCTWGKRRLVHQSLSRYSRVCLYCKCLRVPPLFSLMLSITPSIRWHHRHTRTPCILLSDGPALRQHPPSSSFHHVLHLALLCYWGKSAELPLLATLYMADVGQAQGVLHMCGCLYVYIRCWICNQYSDTSQPPVMLWLR